MEGSVGILSTIRKIVIMYLYGAGGHAKVVRDILEACNIPFTGVVTNNLKEVTFMEKEIRHSSEDVDEAIICVGNNRTRKHVAEELTQQGITFGKAIHPSVIMSKYASVDAGTVVMQGAVIQSCAKIGKHCIVNTAASIDHDNVLGDFVHVSPHATLCGEVEVGEGTWIGAGAIVRQCVKIGKWSVIGAGSVVVCDIPDGVMAYGNPCKIIRKL